MTLTDLIAFSALIVAAYGAILSTCTVIKEFFRLKISVLDNYKSCITLTKSNSYGSINEYGEILTVYDKDLYTLILPVRIVNKSKYNTTINKITLNKEYNLDSSSSFDKNVPVCFCLKNGVPIAYETEPFNLPVLKPLYEVKGLSSIECLLIFNGLKEIPSNIELKVNAIQKTKIFHLNLSNSTNDCRNNYIQERM